MSNNNINWLRTGTIILLAVALVVVIDKVLGKGGIFSRGLDAGTQAVEWGADKLEQGASWTWGKLEQGAEQAGEWIEQLGEIELPSYNDLNDWFKF